MSSVDKVKGHLQAECFNKLYVGGAFVDPIDGCVLYALQLRAPSRSTAAGGGGKFLTQHTSLVTRH